MCTPSEPVVSLLFTTKSDYQNTRSKSTQNPRNIRIFPKILDGSDPSSRRSAGPTKEASLVFPASRLHPVANDAEGKSAVEREVTQRTQIGNEPDVDPGLTLSQQQIADGHDGARRDRSA